MTTITKALLELVPDAKWTLHSDTYAGLEWLDASISKPTQQQVTQKIQDLIDVAAEEKAAADAAYELVKYKDDRKKNYPLLGDQLDMLWHAINSGTLNKTSDFYTAIKAVKDAYPKSE
jgi:hypothetical protein